MKILKSLKKNQQGFALAWVLLFFMMFTIISVSLFFISNQDLREAKFNRNDLRAYYLAESGAELGYAALLKKPSPSDVPLIYSYQADPSKVYTQQITVSGDTIDLRIESVNIDNKWWVKVTSKGTVVSENISETTVLRVNVGMDNFIHVIRE